ncbi:MAG: helix-turn-helix domain-containing protein, partial [Gammaproteobacteria bacterium]|nr:helix-turn-helix domain-containing protein [Gammaproteobacteria bacterium]
MEQDALVYLGVFACFGILIKLAILFNVSTKSKIAQSFVVVCLFFLLQNVSEFLAYFTYLPSEQLSEMFIHIYMNTLYFIFPSILVLALALVEFKYLTAAKIALYGMASLITLGHFGGYIVEDVIFLKWTAITEPGEYYWLAMGFIILNVLATLTVLIASTVASSNFEIRSRCKVNLLAFGPLFLVAFLVMLFRLAGFDSSSAISLPMATIFFLFVMLLQTNGNIFWASLRLKILVSVLTLKNINTLDEILGNIEKIRITEALRASNGMQRNAAKLLSIPPSTLNKKIAKYKIDVEDYQGISIILAIRSR